jgi:hypothetical protein
MAEIGPLLSELQAAKRRPPAAEDVIPQISCGAAVTQGGDLWISGDHALLCADPRAPAAYDQLFGGAKAESGQRSRNARLSRRMAPAYLFSKITGLVGIKGAKCLHAIG